MLVVLVAVAPSLLLLAYFYLRDRYDREPLGHVVAAYLLGVFAMFAAQGLATTLAELVSPDWLRSGGESARIFDAFVLAGVVEELAKWVMLFAAVYGWREFNEPLDGLIYGVAVSLGFAALENVLYLASHGLDIAWKRALFAVPAHALFGGCMGFYAGRAKFAPSGVPLESGLPLEGRRLRFWLALVWSLLVPVGCHGTYDFLLLHGLDWKIWTATTVLSLSFWAFVLRRVQRAQRASPFRPKTMMPTDFESLRRGQ